MDEIIAKFDAVQDDDLMICDQEGIAYQKDMSKQVEYDEDYFTKYLRYEGTPISSKINRGRIALVDKFHKGFCLDVGIGSGEFVKKRFMTMGYDINPSAIEWLKMQGCYSEDFEKFKAFTFWDVIEHVRTPSEYFKRIPVGAHLFTSMPIMRDIRKVRESKHYRPDEHYYYFTFGGFIIWMAAHGFILEEAQNFETEAGRDSIESFAFRKV